MKKEALVASCVTAILIFILELVIVGGVFVASQPTFEYVEQKEEQMFEITDYEKPPEERILTPPMYYQDSLEWGNMLYGDGTISENGCGLCVFASALSFLTQNKELTPISLLDKVGNECLAPDNQGNLVLNDISKFIELSLEIKASERYEESNSALSDIKNEKLVIGSVTGTVGNKEYDGHLVLLWYKFGKIQMLDPKSYTNGGLTEQEFFLADWVYFYTLDRKEQ